MSRRLFPFGAATLFAFSLLLVPPVVAPWHQVVAALLLFVSIGVCAVMLPWERFPAWTQAIPPLAFFVVVGIIRNAAGNGASGFGLLALLPVFWLALYGTRRQLQVCIGVVGALFLVPLIAVGPPDYPVEDWRRGVLGVVIGSIIGLTVQRLVHDRNELLEKLSQMARVDELTGLPNRRAWEEQSIREQSRARRSGEQLNIAMLDLDNFKRYNDLFGHPTGDRLLTSAVGAWRAELRPTDTLARYGGEEFALVLPGCSAQVAAEVLERLRAATPENQTCSIGLAVWDGSESVAAVVERADRALYAAKNAGRDQITLAEPTGLMPLESAFV